ncbi:AsmA family protein [Cognatishimia activa]|uniref:Putative assembly protein n=1 Tax=Cognatishimia activa TaxID=1715691 RepID=A0A0P1IWP5_9RHOB|nr:AsmA family protein [Cognatishimia activa]CUI67060.1 putative assembly protein [Cognatishimia activa]CUK26467.1 putative assembly protein [Cognatishimia activa]
MRIIKILLSVIVVLVLTVVGLVFVLPGEKIANLAADQVKARTGRDLAFTGDVNFSVFPTLGVSTGAVSLSNADWSDKGPMFEADGAKIGVDLMALIGGAVQIKNIELDGAKVLLEQDGEGHANWDLLPSGESADVATSDSAATEEGAGFTLDKLTISDASVRYLDGAGQEITLNDVNASLDWGGSDAVISLTARPASEAVSVEATIGNLDTLLGGDITTLLAEVSAAGNTVKFDGRASIIPEIQGVASASVPNPDAFMAALGLAGAGAPATDFSGDVTFTKDQIFSLRGGKIKLSGNSFSADADVDLKGKPVVTAKINAGDFELTQFTGTGGEGASSESAEGWSKDPIDASALGLFDGQITISASSIATGTLNFGASQLIVDVDRSRAVATLKELNGYDGKISGQFVANNRNGLSVGGKINVAGMQLQGLLTDFADISRFTGAADAALGFLASGNSLHAIMNSLDGDGNVQVGQGTISGIDLDQLFRGTPSGGTTVFDNMTGSWTIASGILTNNDLLMDLPNVQAKGAGTIGLGPQNIDYTFTPQVKNDTDTGIAIPVRVKGPWADPRIWPDLEAVVNQNFKEETKQLEEKAKQAVADKLGVQAEEGQSLEDAAKEKLEKEVGNQLLKLLGQN